MSLALLDVLNGKFLSGISIDEIDDPIQLIKLSIMDNLTRLFFVRQGSIKHLPEYGLPDTNKYYKNISKASYADELAKNIKEAIKKFEPRLKNIKIEKNIENTTEISFKIKAQIIIAPKNIIEFEAISNITAFNPQKQ